MITQSEIEQMIGFKINNVALYQQSFVHRSIMDQESNERLETLGDSVINMVVLEYLFHKYPKHGEGNLTKFRTKIVRGTTLAQLAKKIGIKGHIIMSQQVLNMGGEDNERFLEDAFEALVGAIYLDLGFDAAKSFVHTLVEKYISEDQIKKDDNYKDILLRYTQKLKLGKPIYNAVKNDEQYTVVVELFGKRYGKGKSVKKKVAEQMAAKHAIELCNIEME
jgi:ribonuclease-3